MKRIALKEDEGAVMVMATFVAVFLVAVVYHVAGVGRGALEQQIMQDAADSVAYSAATAKARGMNIISMLNLVMAAVLSVLVALRTLQAILVVAIAIVGVACVISQGAACGAMVPLGNALNKVNKITDKVEPRIKDVLEGLESASEAVAKTVPVLAEAEGVYISTRDKYDPAELGFAWPVVEKLPVKEGSFEELCEKAGENVVVACTFLLPGDLPEFAQETVGELVGGVAGTFSSYFCGGSDSEPPDAMTEEVAHPSTEHTNCDDESARPADGSTGCSSTLCETCSTWACSICLPMLDDDNYVKGLWTRRTDVWVEWTDPGGYPARSIESSGVDEVFWDEGDPCDGEGSCGGDSICSVEEREEAGSGYPEDAERVTRSVVKGLHSCITEEDIEVELQGEPLDPDEWPKPKALDEEELPEGLRVRGFVFGATGYGERMRKVGVAGSDGEAEGPPGRVSFAAADFTSEDEDLWHMNWRSRLIRFRLPSSGDDMSSSCSGAFASECGGVGEKADGFFEGNSFLPDLVLH